MLRNTTSLLLSAALISLAATSYAHNGAMGIVKERMDGMSAMGNDGPRRRSAGFDGWLYERN